MNRMISIRTGVVSSIAVACVALSCVCSARAEGLGDQVKAAMKVMIDDSAKMGEAKAEGSSLFLGTTKMNGNYTLVDSLKEQFKCTATFFIKKGDAFIRISTNVIKDDGSRAVGTPLDPAGPAMAAISKGEAYYGVADILGKKYETGYEPIKNAAGEIVGIYYIGFAVE